jgi:hypothetical protein
LEDEGGKTALDFLSNLSSSNKEVSLEWEHLINNVKAIISRRDEL